jgi:hypothetical protein
LSTVDRHLPAGDGRAALAALLPARGTAADVTSVAAKAVIAPPLFLYGARLFFPPATVAVIMLPLMIFHQIQLMVCSVIASRLSRDQAPA